MELMIYIYGSCSAACFAFLVVKNRLEPLRVNKDSGGLIILLSVLWPLVVFSYLVDFSTGIVDRLTKRI